MNEGIVGANAPLNRTVAYRPVCFSNGGLKFNYHVNGSFLSLKRCLHTQHPGGGGNYAPMAVCKQNVSGNWATPGLPQAPLPGVGQLVPKLIRSESREQAVPAPVQASAPKTGCSICFLIADSADGRSRGEHRLPCGFASPRLCVSFLT